MIRSFLCEYCHEELDRLVKRYLVKTIEYEVYSVNVNRVLEDYFVNSTDANYAVDENLTYRQTDSENIDSELITYGCPYCGREIELEECLIEEEEDDDDNTKDNNIPKEDDIWDLSKTL